MFLTKVIAELIALEYRRVSLEVLTLDNIFSVEIFLKFLRFDLTFRERIFLTELDNLDSEILPFLYDSEISLTPSDTLVDIKMISFPTSKALKSTFILGSWRTPFISRASVMVIPLNS